MQRPACNAVIDVLTATCSSGISLLWIRSQSGRQTQDEATVLRKSKINRATLVKTWREFQTQYQGGGWSECGTLRRCSWLAANRGEVWVENIDNDDSYDRFLLIRRFVLIIIMSIVEV